MVGKAVAAAWNPSKRGCDTCAMRPGWLFTLFFLLLFCILFILCMVPFFWQIRKLHRQPSIYRCVCHRMMLLDYISIQEWKKRILANRCVGVGLILQLFNLLFCWSSEEVRNFYLCFLLLDLATMQGSDKRILGYICDACKRHFASRFAYDRHRRSKFLQGTPCVTAVEQLSDLVAARLANMSTAMLRSASVSSAVDTKNFRQWQNYANYEHTVYFWHNNINYVYYASKPGLVPGTNPGLDA